MAFTKKEFLRLKACPFCGADADCEPWHGGLPTKVAVGCSRREDDCEVGPWVTGETFDEALRFWNRRTSKGK